jgi:RNA polymerase sigma-70 factor, ECF subfamily
MSLTDSQLVAAAAVGDADALTELLRRHGPVVHRRLCIDSLWAAALDAADVMQVTYLEAFLQIHQLQMHTPDGFRSWLDRLAHNNLRDAIRALERQKRPSPRNQVRRPTTDHSATTLLDRVPNSADTPSQLAAGHESGQALSAALAKLPAPYAEVVRLHDLEGRSVGEIAAVLKRSPGAIYMLRARAMDRLRELLGSASRFFSDSA